MKKIKAAVFLFSVLCLLTACGATYYTVTTNAGKKYTAVGEPKLNTKGKTYTFKDNNGHQVILNQSEVREIKSIAGKQ